MRAPRREDITDPANRGVILDALMFLLNITALYWLSGVLRARLGAAIDDDPAALNWLGAYMLAMFVLAPAGATLRRWHYHQRRAAQADADGLSGCGCVWIFYFCLMLTVLAGIAALFDQRGVAWVDLERPGSAIAVTAGIILLAGVHVWLAARYFSPPRRPPRTAFLRSRASELLGDACLFTNMLLYQAIWSLLLQAFTIPVGSAFELAGRLLVIAFLSLLFYFPPRLFYLAEDAGRATTWATIALANSPHLLRMLLGAR